MSCQGLCCSSVTLCQRLLAKQWWCHTIPAPESRHNVDFRWLTQIARVADLGLIFFNLISLFVICMFTMKTCRSCPSVSNACQSLWCQRTGSLLNVYCWPVLTSQWQWLDFTMCICPCAWPHPLGARLFLGLRACFITSSFILCLYRLSLP